MSELPVSARSNDMLVIWILLVALPGFPRQQIQVTCRYSGIHVIISLVYCQCTSTVMRMSHSAPSPTRIMKIIIGQFVGRTLGRRADLILSNIEHVISINWRAQWQSIRQCHTIDLLSIRPDVDGRYVRLQHCTRLRYRVPEPGHDGWLAARCTFPALRRGWGWR